MRFKLLAVVAVLLLVIGSTACDENDTIGIPGEEDIFLAEVAVAVLSVVEDINAIKLIVPEEECTEDSPDWPDCLDPDPAPNGGDEPDPNEGCEIIQNSTLFYCNEDGDIRDCGDGRYRFNSCTNQPPDLTTTKTTSDGELIIGEEETWPTGGMNLLLEKVQSTSNYTMTFDGTAGVVTTYDDGMVTRACLVTVSLIGGVNFEAVANCEEDD